LAEVSLSWYRAVTLAERLAGRNSLGAGDATESLAPEDVAALEYRMASWKTQHPFDDSEAFRRRLDLDGLSEETLSALIAEQPETIRGRVGALLPWIATIEAALSSTPTFEFHELLPEHLKRDPTIPFLDVAAPFIECALRKLTASAEALVRERTERPFDPTRVAALFFPSLAVVLKRIVGRTMVLELNVARLEGKLPGSSPEERFVEFIAQIHERDRLRTIFEEYPVLARLIAEQTTRWLEVTLELLGRLVTDFDLLEERFAASRPLGALADVTADVADPHAGGRSVAILRFASGIRVVYKPKSLSTDLHFQDLLRWLTANGFPRDFRTLTILDRGRYGWSEFATPLPCRASEEVDQFYERTGALLALLYVTRATDFHAGNLLACGAHPVLVDLEALFHPHRAKREQRVSTTASRLARRCVRESVLEIGLLPERVWGNAEHAGVDISGLGAAEGQTTPHAVEGWEESGSDTMRFVRKRRAMPTERNRPVLDGKPVDAVAHRDAIVRGFRSAYRVLVERRGALLAPEGPLGRFLRDDVAVFLRSSRTYRRLLRESYHPDVLRDALDRDRLFDLLWIEAQDDDGLAPVICYERGALWNGDIPSFTATPETSDLKLDGQATLERFFREPAAEAARRLVDRLGEQDCDRQSWLIEASLALISAERRPPALPRGKLPAAPPSRGRLLAAAVAAGERLDRWALRGTGDASWIGLEARRPDVWSIHSTGLDLDAGVPGIAHFLAYLGAATGDERFTGLARAALGTMRDLVRENGSTLDGIGCFDGRSGVIYVLSHLGSLWDRPDLLDEADELATRLSPWTEADDALDVYGGAAGCILALRSLRPKRSSERLTAIATRCGDHLLERLRRDVRDVSRRSHPIFGPAGIAYALAELSEWTGIAHYRSAADSVAAASPADVAAAMREADLAADHSLGGGELGRLDTLARAADQLQDAELAESTVRRMALVLGDIEAHGFRCGTPLGVETPGLLSGLAGIGFGLLRAARPELVPSVLALEPPRGEVRNR